MNYCKKCVMPDTKPGLRFNKSGVCFACINAEKKTKINWEKRNKLLHKICDEIRGKNKNGYDCVVPVSGGKDSMYQTYMMSKIYNLKVLAVSVPQHCQTEEGIENLNSLVTNLNVDLIKVTIRHKTHKKLRLIGLKEMGNPSYSEHKSVFAGVTRVALNFKVPLVVWGEDIGVEFGGNVDKKSSKEGLADDLINNDLFADVSFSEFVKNRIPKNELYFYNHPDIKEFKNHKVKTIYLSHFHNWDGYKNFKLAMKFGFTGRKKGPLSGNILNYDNIDEKLCEMHIWIKMLKYGFWRPTDQSCYHIWNRRMTREEGVENVLKKQYEFPYEYLKDFLDYHSLKEGEFMDELENWRNKDIWVKKNRKWRLKNEIS